MPMPENDGSLRPRVPQAGARTYPRTCAGFKVHPQGQHRLAVRHEDGWR